MSTMTPAIRTSEKTTTRTIAAKVIVKVSTLGGKLLLKQELAKGPDKRGAKWMQQHHPIVDGTDGAAIIAQKVGGGLVTFEGGQVSDVYPVPALAGAPIAEAAEPSPAIVESIKATSAIPEVEAAITTALATIPQVPVVEAVPETIVGPVAVIGQPVQPELPTYEEPPHFEEDIIVPAVLTEMTTITERPETTVEDCLEPAVVKAVVDAYSLPVPVPTNGWTKTAVRKLKREELERLARDLRISQSQSDIEAANVATLRNFVVAHLFLSL